MAANNIPYIPYSRKITFDGDIEQSIIDSYSAVSRLQDCIMSGNLEEFKKIYETEYINNPAIYDYFKYEDENNNNWVNTIDGFPYFNDSVFDIFLNNEYNHFQDKANLAKKVVDTELTSINKKLSTLSTLKTDLEKKVTLIGWSDNIKQYLYKYI